MAETQTTETDGTAPTGPLSPADLERAGRSDSPTGRDQGWRRVLGFFARRPWVLALAVTVVVAILPWTNTAPLTLRVIMLSAIYALVISGVNLTWGYAGEFSLGQAATYACGAYLGAYAAINWTTDLFVGLGICIIAGAALGLVVGLPGLRISGLSFAMTTFFLVLLIPSIAALIPEITGGYTGLPGIPQVTVFGTTLTPNGYYVLCIVLLAVWLAFMRGLVTSEYARTFAVLRESPVLAESLGIAVYRQKVKAYVLGSVPAAMAGFLFCHLDSYVAPSNFGFDLAVALIAGSIIGGTRSIYGVIPGAALLQIGPLVSAGFAGYSLLIYGALLLFGALLTSGGLAGLGSQLVAWGCRRLGVRPPGASQPTELPLEEPAVSRDGAVTEVSGVTRTFGGLVALDGVNLTLRPGLVSAVIGPNGSGKTTLLNVLSGFYVPDAGNVTIGGQRLQGRSAHRVHGLGVGRTFQTPRVPEHLTTLDVVASGAWGEDAVNFAESVVRSPRSLHKQRRHRALAARALAALGIGHLAEQQASSLPLGQRRLIEVARGVVDRPRLLLLDEPASGLSVGETRRLGDVLIRLKETSIATLLVEHNVDFVAETADYVYVLAAGKLIAQGTPDEVMRNPAVIASYTGKAR